MNVSRAPVATCRLQFNREFRFEDARRIIPYLSFLGISDLYASPVFMSRPGSTHGYDVTDPTRFNPELGGETGFERLSGALRQHGMGLLLDIVPNHMAASTDNPWWRDAREGKQDSPYAAFFDTEWLAFGRAGENEAGHRRFFDIGDLVGVRVEDPVVLAATHSLVFRLAREEKVNGLRLDHIDGLYDPLEYLSRLQGRLVDGSGQGFYILVEKILSGDETLPGEWPVSGTTGYEFAAVLDSLFIESEGARAIDEIYSRFTGSRVSFSDVVYEKKRQITGELFSGEIRALGEQLAYLANYAITVEELTAALGAITACLPVYRTYIREFTVPASDSRYLEQAFDEARRRSPGTGAPAFDFVQSILTLCFPSQAGPELKDSWLQFVMKWQQLTGAIMAKGFEDTALYNYSRLISLNEVGGNPASHGISPDDFHLWQSRRLESWPQTLNATSTHDTKRSEDVRARINVLACIPGEWEEHLMQWRRWNMPKKSIINNMPVPEPETEILLYQTLLGAWPLSSGEVLAFKERLQAYLVKALREAKTFTDWLSPDTAYENAVTGFAACILEDENSEFLADFLDLEKKIAFYGAINSLSQVLLKITLPGVPDFYQGMELWQFSLVDPDNRRPVDFEKRQGFLNTLIERESGGKQAPVKEVLDSWRDGRVKLYLTWKALSTRRLCPEIFGSGEYIPLYAEGRRRKEVCAFARRGGETWTITAVPRSVTSLVEAGAFPVGRGVWGEDSLLLPGNAPARWLNVFTGEMPTARAGALALCDVFGSFPVALLKSPG